MKQVYFQSKGINPKYCEVGTTLSSDPNYIYYLDEPCKVLINDVKIVNRNNVEFDKKNRLWKIKGTLNGNAKNVKGKL